MIRKQNENIKLPIFNLQSIIAENVTIITNYRKQANHKQPNKPKVNKSRRELRRKNYIEKVLNYIDEVKNV